MPYAIDFMNPAPDADRNSVGEESFNWIVDAVARLAVDRAKGNGGGPPELRWASFLGALPQPTRASKFVRQSQPIK